MEAAPRYEEPDTLVLVSGMFTPPLAFVAEIRKLLHERIQVRGD